ncbi:MAG: hypothetical protein ACRDQZ_23215, partial [Mycobacteriales bacterium]
PDPGQTVRVPELVVAVQMTIPAVEIRNPSSDPVHIMPSVMERQRSGPVPVVLPYGRVSAFNPVLLSHVGPLQLPRIEPELDSSIDLGGTMVSQ